MAALAEAWKSGSNLAQVLAEQTSRSLQPVDLTLQELAEKPIVEVQSGRVTGFEALLRWNHPLRGLVSPADFIPLAEETGLIMPIDEWALHAACAAAANWSADVDIAVNISPVQFNDGRLPDVVRAALAASGLAADRLVLEVTESVLLQNSDDRRAVLHRLRALGIGVALDDFGTGYSSLSYLRSFPFDEIKIDQSFIRDLGTNRDSVVIVEAVIGLARGLGMTTVAEGVETAQQLVTSTEAGCTRVQGYLFSRPVPEDEVPGLVGEPMLLRTCDAADRQEGRCTPAAGSGYASCTRCSELSIRTRRSASPPQPLWVDVAPDGLKHR